MRRNNDAGLYTPEPSPRAAGSMSRENTQRARATKSSEQAPGRRDRRSVFMVSRAASPSSPEKAATSSIIPPTNFKGLLCRRQQSIAVCHSFSHHDAFSPGCGPPPRSEPHDGSVGGRRPPRHPQVAAGTSQGEARGGCPRGAQPRRLHARQRRHPP
jgi:hypothetical protein